MFANTLLVLYTFFLTSVIIVSTILLVIFIIEKNFPPAQDKIIPPFQHTLGGQSQGKAHEHYFGRIGIIVFGLGALSLTVAILFNSWVFVFLSVIFLLIGLFLSTVKLVTLRSGHWHEVFYLWKQFSRYIGSDNGGTRLMWVLEKVEADPFWVDHSIEINLQKMPEFFTNDDMPFDLKGSLYLRFDPRLVATDVKLSNYLNLEAELISHAKVEIAKTVNTELIKLGTSVNSVQDFEQELRTAQFRDTLRQAILNIFTVNTKQKLQDEENDTTRLADQFGLVRESNYIRGQYADRINRFRVNFSGAAQRARMATGFHEQEDISLEDIVLAIGAANAYTRLKGYVSTDRNQQKARTKSKNVDNVSDQSEKSTKNTSQHDTQSPSSDRQRPRTQSEDWSSMAERIERLTDPAEIIRSRQRQPRDDN
jgi:hypothetical protein